MAVTYKMQLKNKVYRKMATTTDNLFNVYVTILHLPPSVSL